MYAIEKQYREKSSSDLLGCFFLRVDKSWLQNCSPANMKSESDEDFLSPKNWQNVQELEVSEEKVDMQKEKRNM